MKKISLFLLLSFWNIYSQKDSLQVEYTAYYAIDKSANSSSEIDKSLSLLSETKTSLNFILNATGNESFFYHKDLDKDLNMNSKLALALSGYFAPVYFEKSSLKILEDHDDMILGKYVLSKKYKYHNWIITNEKKQIASFTCYKAYVDIVITNPKGQFTNRIFVWFTNEIPFSFGPLGFSGLPGLILEMVNKNVIYGAKIIRFKQFDNFKINKPDDKNAITEDKVRELREDFLNGKD
ncbi:GLPGLI family protein [Flavobacterium sp. j3]|uniref:GLPGLI family protein n=1 Tax=Flavobacterium aureirubrum TaxID=3133147 RepID=A0ABU9N3H3_9FLAO|nr:GLPGLI family protein [Flavobacterium sp.]